jgi:hypothetical protein
MFHPNVRNESSNDPFRNHTESIVPIDESVSDEKGDIFIHLGYQATRDRCFTRRSTEAFSISLPFIANFRKYMLAVTDPFLVSLALSFVFSAIKKASITSSREVYPQKGSTTVSDGEHS